MNSKGISTTIIVLGTIAVLGFLIMNTSSSYACSMMPPSIWLKITDKDNCDAYFSYLKTNYNESQPDEEWVRLNMCSQISLTSGRIPENETANFLNNLKLGENDKTTILQLFEELKNYKTYRYVLKQTSQEYENFKDEVNKINFNICDCEKLQIVNRIGDWTSYELTFKDTCDFSPACYTPPFPCPGTLFGMSSIIILIIVGVVIISAVFYLKKRKNR